MGNALLIQPKKRIQPLLFPVGSPTILETAIKWPKDLTGLKTEFNNICEFAYMNNVRYELEHIPQAIVEFARQASQGKVCEVKYMHDDHEMGVIRALSPMDNVLDTIDFIEDQLSKTPRIVMMERTDFKEMVLGQPKMTFQGDGIIGWLDLDTPRFFFLDNKRASDSCFNLKALFGLLNCPVVNQDLEYQGRLGMRMDEGINDMRKIANQINRSVSTSWNGKRIVVSPSGV